MNALPALAQAVEDRAVDTDFTHTAPADPSGNALGPFTVGRGVKLRTRVTDSNGTTTGSIRTLTILNPAP